MGMQDVWLRLRISARTAVLVSAAQADEGIQLADVPPRHRGPAWAEGEVRQVYYSTRAQTGCTPASTGTDMGGPIMASLEPEPNCDQLTQAVIVGLCLAQAAVLLVLALVP
jgi:hypothetical protein